MNRKVVTLTLPSGAKLPVQIGIVRQNGDWFVAASFSIGNQPIRLTATASEALVRQAIERLGTATETPETGGWFDDLAKKVAKFTRSKALGQVLQGVASVAKSPMFQQLAKFYPPLQTAMQYVGRGAEAAVAAQSLIQRAQGKDPKAAQAIARITQAAKSGNKDAALMHNVLFVVNKAAKEVAPSRLTDFRPPISAGAPFTDDEDPDVLRLVRTVRATM